MSRRRPDDSDVALRLVYPESYMQNPSWCFVVKTQYVIPASAQAWAHSEASKSSPRKVLA